MNSPTKHDAILSKQQNQNIENAAVLGGKEGRKRQFDALPTEEKLQAGRLKELIRPDTNPQCAEALKSLIETMATNK